VAQSSDWRTLLTNAGKLAAAGKLREAQEAYLAVLLVDPNHEAAMRGLVRVVRTMARGDRAALRRQAEEYRRAIAGGLETEEHYTAPAMELLLRATLQAAGEIQPSARPAVRRASPQPTAPPAERQPAQKPKTQPPAKPRPTSPLPEPARPAPPPPSPPLDANEPFFTVAVGPISSGDLASTISAELTIAGFSARVQRQGVGSYLITLGPYRQSEARRAADYVRSRFGRDVPIALAPAP
jgi:cell division protein FtsN